MALADDVARLTREVWRLNQLLGWQQRFGWDGDAAVVAKAAGASPGQVQSWLDGTVAPTTAQALAVLDSLPYPATGATAPPAAMNGAHS